MRKAKGVSLAWPVTWRANLALVLEEEMMTSIFVVSSMMPLVAALEVVIAAVVVAVASAGIELCALRDGKEAGSSEADVTVSMGRVSATEAGTEGKTFSVINCEGDASVAKSRVGVGSTET